MAAIWLAVGLVVGFVAGVLVVLFWALGKAAKMGDR